MILSDIKDYIQSQGQASLRDIAVRFDVDEKAAEEMLAHWERKGKIVRLNQDQAACENICGQSCEACPAQCTAIFVWNEADAGGA